MLPLLVSLLAAGGLLLRGAADLGSQTALLAALAAGTSGWLAWRVTVGYVPLPSARLLVWAGTLAALGWMSVFASPVSSLAAPGWRIWLAALGIFLFSAAISKDERALIDQALRAGSWVLLGLAFYQHSSQGIPTPAAGLAHPSVFAGSLLLLLPLAVQTRDWVLAAGLFWALTWSAGVGAWLGLAAGLWLVRREAGRPAYWGGLGLGLLCAAVLYSRLESPDSVSRWRWWGAAARMIAENPVLGFGPSSFAHVGTAYQSGLGPGAATPHQLLLQLGAEHGLPFLAVWLAGVAHCLRFGGPHKAFGAAAVLTQSLWDAPLAAPGNLWLFSYFAASTVSEARNGVNVPSRYKLAAGFLAVGVGAAAVSVLLERWDAERLREAAIERLHARVPSSEATQLAAASLRRAETPDAARLLAESELRLGEAPRGKRLLPAAAALERAVALNPYQATAWLQLRDLYRGLGLPALAAAKEAEGRAFCPSLR